MIRGQTADTELFFGYDSTYAVRIPRDPTCLVWHYRENADRSVLILCYDPVSARRLAG